VLDRESTFADPEVVKLLQTKFVPVAIDQAYQRRQKDAEGEFYREIAGQGPRSNFNGTTQGFYIATAAGELMAYNNNRGPQRVRRLMQKALDEFPKTKAGSGNVEARKAGRADHRYNPTPPEGGLVVRVRAKVLGGYEETTDPWQAIFQSAVARDNLWITNQEQQALAAGRVPEKLQRRIARYHLVDNTRGEPPMWKDSEIRSVDMSLSDGTLRGSVHLETADGRRGYQAQLFGKVETEGEKVTRLDVVAEGEFWGAGPFTGHAPQGKFPLAVTFALADGSDVADQVPPQGSRGWVAGYLGR